MNAPTPTYTYERIQALAPEPDATGYREVTVNVERGETAWHPASTKKVLYGPVSVLYRLHADGGVTGTIIEGEVLR